MNEVKKVVIAIKTIQREMEIMKAFLQIMEEKDEIDIKTLGVKKMGLVAIIDKAREIISKLEKDNPNIFKEEELPKTSLNIDTRPVALDGRKCKMSVEAMEQVAAQVEERKTFRIRK